MNDVDTVVRDILSIIDSSAYPEEFLKNYDQLECLANRHGTETFLVKKKDTEQLFIAKCYDMKIYTLVNESNILKSLSHKGLPIFADEFKNDEMVCIVREYIEGSPLNQYIKENELTTKDIIGICVQLCDILAYIHGQEKPVIHRDIKPQNIIVKEDGQITLIDFDISRVYNSESETDTQFLGTKEYAPPEQYGFSQTDCRTDIYSFGIMLRYMLTGSEKENPNIRVYKPLEYVIRKCTAFAPKERFANVMAVKKALLAADPKVKKRKNILCVVSLILVFIMCTVGIVKWVQYNNREVFTEDHVPVFVLSQEQMNDSVNYLNDKYNTDYFIANNDIANMGYMRQMLVDVYGLSEEYAFAMPPAEQQWPEENENNFYPWGLPETEHIEQEIVVYTIVKLLWPDIVNDYSILKDDNGEYPGVRVAMIFAEKRGILKGANRPGDLTNGDVAYIISNAEKLHDSMK